MMHKQIRALSLIELLISLTLMVLLMISYFNIDYFSRYHTTSSIRRARIQNEITVALGHMNKEIACAIGDVNQSALSITTISGDDAIKIWVDGNPFQGPPVAPDGKRDPYPDDHQIAYRFIGASGALANRYQIWYYANCVGPNCNQAGSTAREVIARNIYSFTPSLIDNYLNVVIEARWKPGADVSLDNPRLTMRTQIKMPAVSAR